MKDLENLIEKAIVDRFFEPSWLTQPQYIVDPQTGHGRTEMVMSQIPAPMTIVAQAVYEAAQPQIIAAVLEKLDIDAIVEQWSAIIAKDVVNKLQEKNSNSWSAKADLNAREKMMLKVYDDVAAEFGRQAVEHIKKTGGLRSVLEA